MIRGEGEYSSEKGNIQGVEGRKRGEKYSKLGEKRCIFYMIFMYFIKHCFICRSSDFAVSEDAGIESNPGLLRDLGIGSQML